MIEQPREDWQVLIQDAHPGYIAWEEFERNQVTLMHNRTAWTSSGPNPLPRESPSWEEFERNQVTLKQNLAALSTEGRGTLPREGIALLQGRVLCGRCGARMRTRYEQFRDHLIPYYVCTDAVVRRAGKFCQSIRGSDIDEAVGELLLKTLAPAALDVALAVQAEIAGRIEQADTLRQQQLERARYEAELKRRRFLKCDPDHRLVADALEADWNDQLRRLETLQQEHERQRQADQSLLDEAARARILSLARNFPRMWNDPRTESRDRKRMLALLIEDVTLTKTDPIAVHVRFRGGQTTSLTVQGAKSVALIRKFSPEFIAELDQLLETYPEKEAAEQLNARGRRNWKQRPLTRSAVFNLRFIYKLKSHYQRLRERGMLSSEELGQRLGVSATMINKMGRAGLLVRHFYGNRDCLYDPVQAGTIRKGKAGRPSITLDDPSQVRFRRDRPRWNPDERHSGRFDRLRLMRIGILAVRLCMRRIVKFDDSDDAKITPAQHEVGDELLKFTSNCLPIRGAGTNIDDLRQCHLGQDDVIRIHDTQAMLEKLLPHRQRRPCKNRPVRILAGYVVCELPQQPQPCKRGYQQYYPHGRRLTLSQRVARLVLCRYDDQNDHKRDPQPSAPGFSMRHTWISRHVGRRLLKENLQEGRAAYGKRILVTLSQELKAEFGDGFSYSALTRMVRFAESFVDEAIGFKGRFVRKKDFQYAHIAMPLNSLDRARTIPDDADGLRASRNPMVE